MTPEQVNAAFRKYIDPAKMTFVHRRRREERREVVAYAEFRHRVPLRVRWAEVDLQGVVFNGALSRRTAMSASPSTGGRSGWPIPAAFLAIGADLFVRKATLEYHAPAAYDDELEICGRTSRLGTTSLTFRVEMFRARKARPRAGRRRTGLRLHRPDQQVAAAAAGAAARARAGFRDDRPRRGERRCCGLNSGDWDGAAALGGADPLRRSSSTSRRSRWKWRSTTGIRSACMPSHSMAKATRSGTGRLLPDGHIGRMAVLQSARGSRRRQCTAQRLDG